MSEKIVPWGAFVRLKQVFSVELLQGFLPHEALKLSLTTAELSNGLTVALSLGHWDDIDVPRVLLTHCCAE